MRNPESPHVIETASNEALAQTAPPLLPPEKTAFTPVWRNAPWLTLAVCAALGALVLAVFAQTRHFEFINLDDSEYVSSNPMVIDGLTWGGVVSAFIRFHASNWHPLTWISHMVDCQLFGLNPAGHHLSNVAIHGAAVVLLFLALAEMTGCFWRSAFVAAVFAIHPLRAESVAWVSERKDILSGFFFVLTLWAYARHVRRPGHAPARFVSATVVACFIAGLLCKPMLVTVPFLLLLLDYWPLNRVEAGFDWSGVRRLAFEKAPLFLLSGASCIVTLFAQRGAMLDVRTVPLWVRMGNVFVAIAAYLRQTFWPTGMALLYPYPRVLQPAETILAVLAIALITSTALWGWKKQPWLIVGWFWFLGMLFPVLGIVQVGMQARADRYTYLPQIGLCIAVAWTVAELSGRLPLRRWLLAGAAGVLVVALAVAAHPQTSHWRDSESVWSQSVSVTRDNYMAYGALGTALLRKGRPKEAIFRLRQALAINPTFTKAAVELDNALLLSGRVNEAIAHLRKMVAEHPTDATAHSYLGRALETGGLHDEAILHGRKALELQPGLPEADGLLAVALFEKGKIDESVAHCRAAIRSMPTRALLHSILADGLVAQKHLGEALSQYDEALRLQPGIPKVRNNIAWILATAPDAAIRNGPKAVELAEAANRVANGADPDVLSTLAAAYAETGRFVEATAVAQKALDLTDPRLVKNVEQCKEQLRDYSDEKPFRDSSLNASPTVKQTAPL